MGICMYILVFRYLVVTSEVRRNDINTYSPPRPKALQKYNIINTLWPPLSQFRLNKFILQVDFTTENARDLITKHAILVLRAVIY